MREIFDQIFFYNLNCFFTVAGAYAHGLKIAFLSILVSLPSWPSFTPE
jgi:hypothetical protein